MCVYKIYIWIYCVSVGYTNIFYSMYYGCMEIPLGEGYYNKI